MNFLAETLYQSRLHLERALERPLGPVFQAIGPRGRLRPAVLGERFELSSGQVVADLALDSFVTWGVGLHNALEDGPIDYVKLENLLVRNATKWASRLYRARRSMRVQSCAFVGTDPEHDLYWNLAGFAGEGLSEPSVTVSDCLFADTASQAIQFVQRDHEGTPGEPGFYDLREDLTRGGLVVLERNVIVNAGHRIGDGNARASFAVSLFPSLNDVLIRDLFVDKTMQEDSTGCLLVQGHRRVRVKNAALVIGGEAHQPLAKLENIETLELEGCHLEAARGQNWIDLHNVGRVVMRGCSGSARVHVNSTDRGLVSENLTLEA